MPASLTVSIIALAVAVASLTWQVVLYLLGASRPVVGLEVGVMGDVGVVTAPIKAEATLEQMQAQGYSTAVMQVTVRNRGRLAVSVTNWAIEMSNGASYSHLDWAPNNRYALPHRLEPGAEASFLCPADMIHRIVDVSAKSTKPVTYCRGRVSFGTGRTKRSADRYRFRTAARASS